MLLKLGNSDNKIITMGTIIIIIIIIVLLKLGHLAHLLIFLCTPVALHLLFLHVIGWLMALPLLQMISSHHQITKTFVCIVRNVILL